MARSTTCNVATASRDRRPRLFRCVLSLAGVLAYFTLAASASAFGPEAAPGVEATSDVASVAPSLAPEAPVVESVVLGRYHESDTAISATPPDPAAPDESAETSQPPEDSARPAHPGVAGHYSRAKASVSPHGWNELRTLRKAQHAAPRPESGGQLHGRWYREKNYQYQFDVNTTPMHPSFRKDIQPVRSHSSQSIMQEPEKPILIWIRRQGDRVKPQNHPARTDVLKCASDPCEHTDIELATRSVWSAVLERAARRGHPHQAPGLASMLKAADPEALDEAGRRFIIRRSVLPLPAPVRSAVLSRSSPSVSRLHKPTSVFAAGVLRTGERAARAIDRNKSVTSSIVPRPGAVLRPTGSIRPREVAERLPDTRRLVQIGLLLGMAYVGFLMLWFWTTRGRRRRLHGGARF
jgi:hypothetical protein